MKPFVCIAFLLLAGAAFSQEIPATTEQQLENLGEEDLKDDSFLQQLSFYQKHPVNLNTATAEDLYPLRFLTELQIQTFLRYRAAFGNLLSVYELQAVPGFDLLTIGRIRPYVFVGEEQSVQSAITQRLHNGSTAVLVRLRRVLEKSKGYDTTLKTHYLGDRNHLLLRYTYQYKTLLYYGITADKDAGEPFFRNAQKWGFDFYSLHFFLRNVGKLKALALGDYTINLGQGLVQWQSLAFGKSADITSIKRQAPVLLPYRSAGEFAFSRGAAATFQLGQWQLTGFLSLKKFSGNLVTDSVERFSSFGTSGYYRTRSEIADRYQLQDFSTGGNLSFSQNSWKVGVSAVAHRFSKPLQKRDEPYNRFALSGRDVLLFSADYGYTVGNLHLFGEMAADKAMHRAFVQGALVSVDAKMDLSFLYRNIQKEYQSPFGNAFTENTLPSNEAGFYAGLQLRPLTGLQAAVYADFYRFPFLKYRVSSPTRGTDYLVQVSYVPEKKTELYLRYRTETKPLNEAGTGRVIQFPTDGVRKNLRLNVTTALAPLVTMKARTEFLWMRRNEQRESGFMLFVETAVSPSAKWKANLRLQYFDTDSYDSRIYAYESDVLYSVSIPAFFDKGFRYYFNAEYKPAKRWFFWFRFAQTLYPGKQKIGSGLDEILTNHHSEVTLQLRFLL